MTTATHNIEIDRDKGDFKYAETHKFDAGVGLNEGTVDYISDVKGEDDWIRDFRKRALKVFQDNQCPRIGPPRT